MNAAIQRPRIGSDSPPSPRTAEFLHHRPDARNLYECAPMKKNKLLSRRRSSSCHWVGRKHCSIWWTR